MVVTQPCSKPAPLAIPVGCPNFLRLSGVDSFLQQAVEPVLSFAPVLFFEQVAHVFSNGAIALFRSAILNELPESFG